MIDSLSMCAALTKILSYLNPRDVIICLSVNQRIRLVVQNNWKRMAKEQISLEFRPALFNHSGTALRIRRTYNEHLLGEPVNVYLTENTVVLPYGERYDRGILRGLQKYTKYKDGSNECFEFLDICTACAALLDSILFNRVLISFEVVSMESEITPILIEMAVYFSVNIFSTVQTVACDIRHKENIAMCVQIAKGFGTVLKVRVTSFEQSKIIEYWNSATSETHVDIRISSFHTSFTFVALKPAILRLKMDSEWTEECQSFGCVPMMDNFKSVFELNNVSDTKRLRVTSWFAEDSHSEDKYRARFNVEIVQLPFTTIV